MKWISKCLLLVLLSAPVSAWAITDAAALLKAKLLWGTWAQIAKTKKFVNGLPQAGWTYQVGCYLPPTSNDARPVANPEFIVAGESGVSWVKAFGVVNLANNGPHVITATARDAAGNSTESAPVNFFSCNEAGAAVAFPPAAAPLSKGIPK